MPCQLLKLYSLNSVWEILSLVVYLDVAVYSGEIASRLESMALKQQVLDCNCRIQIPQNNTLYILHVSRLLTNWQSYSSKASILYMATDHFRRFLS